MLYMSTSTQHYYISSSYQNILTINVITNHFNQMLRPNKITSNAFRKFQTNKTKISSKNLFISHKGNEKYLNRMHWGAKKIQQLIKIDKKPCCINFFFIFCSLYKLLYIQISSTFFFMIINSLLGSRFHLNIPFEIIHQCFPSTTTPISFTRFTSIFVPTFFVHIFFLLVFLFSFEIIISV